MGFSDFARYTLGTNYHSKISGITIESYNLFREIYKSSKKNRTELDKLINFSKNYKSKFIKQEWKDSVKHFNDNLPEIIKFTFKLSDENTKLLQEYLSKITDDYFSGQRFDISNIQRLIVNDVFKVYGWKKNYLSIMTIEIYVNPIFEKKTYSKNESIGKKYVLISYYKWLAIILDNYLIELDYSNIEDEKLTIYTGAWATNRRDIDPTLLERDFYKEDTYKNNKVTFWYPQNCIDWTNNNYSKWVLSIDDLIHPKELINIKDKDNSQWLNLYSYPSWYSDENSKGNKSKSGII
jgi:hypothetical protein